MKHDDDEARLPVSLRDYFAAHALQGYLSNMRMHPAPFGGEPVTDLQDVLAVVALAFQAADAMLLHRGIWVDKDKPPG